MTLQPDRNSFTNTHLRLPAAPACPGWSSATKPSN